METRKIEFLVQPGYLLVKRPDNYEVVPSEQPHFLETVADHCAKAGCRKVLIIGRGTKVNLGTADIFKLGEAVAKLGLRIALVERDDAAAQEREFLENVATNRGSPLRFFESDVAAKEWLGVE